MVGKDAVRIADMIRENERALYEDANCPAFFEYDNWQINREKALKQNNCVYQNWSMVRFRQDAREAKNDTFE